ncbi:MAG: hypothetical protein KAW92_07075 [Candidatus Cloacimonetes bacterium]|nr:hypothetical protein [Candidatus Cloacimonadota bacterium]
MGIISLVFIGLFVTLASIGVASAIHHSRQKHYLIKELAVNEKLKSKVSKIIGIEEGAVIGVSVFDVLFNISRMDPHALSGISHLHHSQDFNNLGDLIGFMKENILTEEEGSKAWRQIIHKYKGYTGEEMAFDNLRNTGHSVDIPESGTMEGLDATVDNQPINVKITDNPSYIQEHLDAHPDIPVYTNIEMKQAFADNPNVIIDPDLSAQEAFHETADTLDVIGDIGDFIDNIPLITLTISTVRNVRGVIKHNKNIPTALEHIVCDTAAVGFGGWAGSEVGLAIGLALAPATGGTSAIIIPAATTLIGTIVGIFTGKSVVNWFKQRHLRAAIKKLKLLATNFRLNFLQSFNRIVNKSVNYYNEQITQTKLISNEKEGFFKRILFPSILSKFYQMACSRFRQERRNVKRYYYDLRYKVREAEESEGGLLVYAQGKDILNNDPDLIKEFNEIEITIENVEKEKKKFK